MHLSARDALVCSIVFLTAMSIGCGRLEYDPVDGRTSDASRPLDASPLDASSPLDAWSRVDGSVPGTVCPAGQTCMQACATGSGCAFLCGGGSTCSAECVGDCTMTCGAGSMCELTCESSGTQSCSGGCFLSCPP